MNWTKTTIRMFWHSVAQAPLMGVRMVARAYWPPWMAGRRPGFGGLKEHRIRAIEAP
ncbi:MAG: hypothetical protein JNM65_16260 [Verrucomicrobiaceae bacterium]|nr:hypothetical protein [Verrucomicrobiaceae bacterium]